jgi:hypothetical protein
MMKPEPALTAMGLLRLLALAELVEKSRNGAGTFSISLSLSVVVFRT